MSPPALTERQRGALLSSYVGSTEEDARAIRTWIVYHLNATPAAALASTVEASAFVGALVGSVLAPVLKPHIENAVREGVKRKKLKAARH